VIQTKLFEKIVQLTKHLELAGLHAVEHEHETSLNTDTTIRKLGVLEQHVQALITILLGKGNAGAFKSLPPSVSGPATGISRAPQARNAAA
jgi:hypothetical protein